MSSLIGKQALVVGAGMGGLTAARVLADYFEQVLVLERDTLPVVAVQEARALGHLLADRVSSPAPLHGLAPAFFAEAEAIIETPWAMAALPDFIFPETRGERPADFEQQLKVGMAMGKLAARDPAVHKLVAEVAHLLKPRRVYQDLEMQQRLHEVMAEA